MDIQKLSDMLKVEEGFRSKPYTDATGHITVGYGRNLDAKGISEVEGAFMLGNDMSDACKDLDKNIPWWKDIDEIRQLVLADMSFNLGWGNGQHGLSSFPNFLEHCRKGEWTEAARHGRNTLWFNQVGRRGVRLMNMLETGQDQTY